MTQQPTPSTLTNYRDQEQLKVMAHHSSVLASAQYALEEYAKLYNQTLPITDVMIDNEANYLYEVLKNFMKLKSLIQATPRTSSILTEIRRTAINIINYTALLQGKLDAEDMAAQETKAQVAAAPKQAAPVTPAAPPVAPPVPPTEAQTVTPTANHVSAEPNLN